MEIWRRRVRVKLGLRYDLAVLDLAALVVIGWIKNPVFATRN